jgi:hypothetical protein
VSRLAFIVLVLVLAATVVACSLFVDLDGLNDGDAGANAADANIDAGPDASFDASSDAAVDAGRGCSAQRSSVIFCADFDEADAGLDSFQPYSMSGSVLIDESFGESPPASLHITQQEIDAGNEGNSIMCNTTSAPTKLRLAFDFNIVAFGDINPNTGMALGALFITVNAQTQLQAMSINATATTLRVVETDPQTLDGHFHDDFPFTVADRNWHHVELLIDMSSSQAIYTLTTDGTTLDTGPTLIPWTPGVATAQIGMGYSNAPGLEFDGHYDDIVIDTQ